MANFIYSIEEIFNKSSGCLFHYTVKGYYIAPYQRGYKWKSTSIHDQVPVLLLDIYEAFKKKESVGQEHEYYLQYITVKKTPDKFFEVIDGQQRLTTLSILYRVLESYHCGNITKIENEYLVRYSRYENEQSSIFDQIAKLSESPIDEDDAIEEQDKYYMLKAFRCISDFFKILDNPINNELNEFIKFLEDDVKLILNIEDEHTAAEEIFANLNDNKVPLTNTYLIKGLLLTKASRELVNKTRHKNFKEIMDQRAIMGRLWDEMNSWFFKPEVALFFFGHKDNGMESLLKLVNLNNTQSYHQVSTSFKETFRVKGERVSNPFGLFNQYYENVITTEDAANILNAIKHTYKRLKSWYYDNSFYNLFGYAFVVNKHKYWEGKTKKSALEVLLNETSNVTVKNSLKHFVLSRMPNDIELELKELRYDAGKNEKDKLNNLLLGISVFPPMSDRQEYRFDYYSYVISNWSLEHIFPQNPAIDKFDVADDKDWVLRELIKRVDVLEDGTAKGDKEIQIQDLQSVIEIIKSGSNIDSSKISFLFDAISDKHQIGNMALLSPNVNSALRNGFFNTKRKILLRELNKGEFVPKHTIDVFSKMLEIKKEENGNLNEFNSSLTIWNNQDIEAHTLSLKQSIAVIKNSLSII